MPTQFVRTIPLLAAIAGLAVAQSYTMTTVAGSSRLGDGSPATSVPLRYPFGMAQDAAGNVYFSDNNDNRVRRVAPDGTISTIAGNGVPNFSGDGGQAPRATLNAPQGVRLDGKGNLFIADYNNNRVRKVVLATGIITTVAGNGNFQFSGDGGRATLAGVDPDDIALDNSGNLYIADFFNNRIRKVSADDNTISTIAGTGIAGDGDNGPANAAALDGPIGISVDSQGIVYFVDSINNRVKRIDQNANKITTAVGTGDFGFGLPSYDGDGGPATAAFLTYPFSTAIEPNGDLLVNCIVELWRVTMSDGKIHFIAGSDSLGFGGDGGPAIFATFGGMRYTSVAANDDILIADVGNYRVRRIHSNAINTVAGTTISDNILGTSAFLNNPAGVLADGKGGFYIGDTGDSRVRQVSATGSITNAVGTGVRDDTLSTLFFPRGMAMDALGTLYVADSGNDRIMRVLAGGGGPTVAAGDNGAGYAGDGGYAPRAKLANPHGVAVDSAGNLYIADTNNFCVRIVDANQNISTFAGTGVPGFSGDNGPASKAKISASDVAVDNSGNLYIADALNNRIRKVNLATKIISTVAGIGTAGYSGDGGLAFSARLFGPTGVAMDAASNLYIADYGNSVVRRVSTGGTITTIAGTGLPVFDVETGTALGVSVDPARLSVAQDGTIYIADYFNDRIRKLVAQVPAVFAIVAGDTQSGPPGTKVTISVKVTDAKGAPVGNVLVNFTVTSGLATLSAAGAQTGGDGIASVQVTFGTAPGPVKITAVSSGISGVTFNLAVTQPVVMPPVPAIDPSGVKGAALSSPPVQALSTGGIASVFGKNFGGSAMFQKVGAADLVNGMAPTSFLGICVNVGGARAPIFGASNTQVNFQVPTVAATGTVSVSVVSPCGTSNDLASSAVSVAAQAATPEFFYYVQHTDGVNPVAATDSISSAYLAATTLFPGSGITPAYPGEYVTVYATGFGATNPSYAPGQFPDQLAQVTGAVSVLLGGRELPAANVLYAGVTPNGPGLYQLNLLLPDDTPDGDLSLTIVIGGIQSPSGPYMTVAHH
jgi:uncharacterized protein (TIGR03437 family)